MITQANPAGTARIDLRSKREQAIDAAVRRCCFPIPSIEFISIPPALLAKCFQYAIRAEFSRLMSAA